MTDTTKGTASLERLAHRVEAEAGRFSKLKAEQVCSLLLPRMKSTLHELRTATEPLKKRRDELIAHNADRRTMTDKEWAISWSDLQHADENALALINEIAVARGGEAGMVMCGARRENVQSEIRRILGLCVTRMVERAGE